MGGVGGGELTWAERNNTLSFYHTVEKLGKLSSMNKFTNSCQRCSHLIELFCEKGSATLSTKPTSMMLLALDSVLQIVFLGRDAVPCKLQAAHDESPCRPALAPGLQ